MAGGERPHRIGTRSPGTRRGPDRVRSGPLSAVRAGFARLVAWPEAGLELAAEAPRRRARAEVRSAGSGAARRRHQGPVPRNSLGASEGVGVGKCVVAGHAAFRYSLMRPLQPDVRQVAGCRAESPRLVGNRKRLTAAVPRWCPHQRAALLRARHPAFDDGPDPELRCALGGTSTARLRADLCALKAGDERDSGCVFDIPWLRSRGSRGAPARYLVAW